MKISISGLALAALAACAAPTRTSLASPSVAGTTWVAALAGDVDPQQKPRLEFLADGRLGGYTGCNTLGGTWRLAGDAVQLGTLVMTKRACLGPGADVEKRFLAAVNERARVVIEGTRLVAQGAGGERVEFSAAPRP